MSVMNQKGNGTLTRNVDQLWSPHDLARYLGCSVQAIYMRRQRGTLPAAIRVGPKQLRWRPSDIAAWLEAGQEPVKT